jgi:hypothetical protein
MKKSFMDERKEEEREAFLKLSPVERIRIMHNLFLEIVSIKARGEKVSQYEIYRRYLKDNPRHYERASH